MTARTIAGLALALAACTTVAGGTTVGSERRLEGRAPTPAELTPSVEAAFLRESYAPGARATLVVSNRARGLVLQVFRSGPERVVTRSDLTMNGVPVTPKRRVGASTGGRIVPIRIGSWPSGLYFVRLKAEDGRIGFAPFVVRPRRLGEHRVAVVLPTLTWQAYNLRDEDDDGVGDSWYASWRTKSVRLGRPFLSRGVPYNFRRYDLPFLNWVARTGKAVDVLAQSDLESATTARGLAAAYDLIVFPGHHEYVTKREYDLVEGFRDLGGSLLFLSANNFFWQVERARGSITKTRLWRDLGRPEASLIGVQYLANGKAPRQPWIVRRSRAGSWIFAGTGLREGSRLGRGGVEIDRTGSASPRGIEVVAEIPDLFGPGMTAQMTYYETAKGAKVFAAGAFYFTRLAHVDTVTSRTLENLWARLSSSASGRDPWKGASHAVRHESPEAPTARAWPVTYVSAALLSVGTLALAYARRRNRAEAATLLVVALPVVLSVPPNAPHWYRSLRANYVLDYAAAVAVAPPLIQAERNLPLAQRALASIAPDGTYAVIPYRRYPRRSAAALRERAHTTYLVSWLQYWLAPRIQVDPPDAEWLILLDASGIPPPANASEVHRIGDDVLVRK
jgi:hypothetical protein